MKFIILIGIFIITTLKVNSNSLAQEIDDNDSCKRCGIIIWDGSHATFEKSVEFDKNVFLVEFDNYHRPYFILVSTGKNAISIYSKLGVFIFDKAKDCIYVIKEFYGASIYTIDILEQHHHVISLEFESSSDYFDLMENLDRLNINMINELREAKIKNWPQK